MYLLEYGMNQDKIIWGIVLCTIGFLAWFTWTFQRANGHPPSDCPKIQGVDPVNTKEVSKIATNESDKQLRIDHIKTFQRVNGLKEDGIIGPETAKECHYYCFGFYNNLN